MDILNKFAAGLRSSVEDSPSVVEARRDWVAAHYGEQVFQSLELHRALQRGELRVFYQPTIAMDTGRIVSMKALLRWDHPYRGLLNASQFLGVADRSGLFNPIVYWAIEHALHDLKQMDVMGVRRVPLTLPLSSRQLLDPGFAGRVSSYIREAGVDGGSLVFELPSGVSELGNRVASALRVLHWLGVDYALTAPAQNSIEEAWAEQQKLAINTIRVSARQVGAFEADEQVALDIVAQIRRAHEQQQRVIAEGAESEQQARFLRQVGCDQIQGHYVRPAVMFEQMCELLYNNERLAI